MLQVASGVGLYAERLAVALGFVTLFGAVATFGTCRSCLSFLGHFGLKNLTEKRWYRPIYKYHGYYWWVFLFGLTLHFLTTIMHTAIPQAGDPDAPIHWIILSFAIISLPLLGTVLASCRSLVGMLNLFMEKGPLNNYRFREFYRYHAYFWLLLVLAVAGHIGSAYVHVGIWPG